jgi:hypothetical protein
MSTLTQNQKAIIDNLTEKEKCALVAIHETAAAYAGIGESVWSSEVMSGAYCDEVYIKTIGNKKSFSGLCSSLQKKNLICCDESCGDDTVCVTKLGLSIIK